MFMTGMQFNGRRDLYELYGYQRWLQPNNYIGKYLRQDIAKRVVDAPVQAMWADPPLLSGDPAFMASWDNFCEEIPVWNSIIRLDKLAGLGTFAVMVLGVDDGQALDQPLTLKDGRKFIYMQPYAEVACTINHFETNTNSPRFGKPLMYHINPGKFEVAQRIAGAGATMTRPAVSTRPFDVHYTRVLHVAENLLEDGVYGRSRMECVYNLLDDILKVAGGSAELFWIMANRGIHVDVDKDMELNPKDEENLTAEVQEYMDDMRRFIRTRGAKVTSLGSNVADPTGPFNVLLSLISAATGIPKLVLSGTTSGTLASAQDRANWAERVAERVTEYGEPIVLKPLIKAGIQCGVFPKPTTLNISWAEAFKLSPLERAQTSAQMARSAANLTKVISQVPQGGTVQNADGTTTTTKAVKPLFTNEELRNIVGFGKRMPVFDSTDDTTGTGKAKAKTKAAATTTEDAT